MTPREMMNLPLAQLFGHWPATIAVFLKHRMKCVGCLMARFDTLDEALGSYGLEPRAFLAELEAAVVSDSHPAQPHNENFN